MRAFGGHRFTIRLLGIALVVLTMTVSNGCGLNYIANDRETGLPSTLVVTGWTNDGCIENLYDTAEKMELKINLVDIEREYEGFGIIPGPTPFYPMYTCKGQIIPFGRP